MRMVFSLLVLATPTIGPPPKTCAFGELLPFTEPKAPGAPGPAAAKLVPWPGVVPGPLPSAFSSEFCPGICVTVVLAEVAWAKLPAFAPAAARPPAAANVFKAPLASAPGPPGPLARRDRH